MDRVCGLEFAWLWGLIKHFGITRRMGEPSRRLALVEHSVALLATKVSHHVQTEVVHCSH
jgi:hypothetical protein